MKIDLHIHTSEGSDGQAPASRMIEAAIARGLDGVVITDHNCLLKREDQERLQRRYPSCRVFRGCETTLFDTGEHVGVIGGSLSCVPKLMRTNQRAWAASLRDAGAFTVLNHPFGFHAAMLVDLDSLCPDGMEFLSMHVDTARAEEFVLLARQRGIRPVAGSDAHSPEQVGMFYTELDRTVRDEAELVRELAAGRYALATFPDMWQARVTEAERAETWARQVLRDDGSLADYLAFGDMNAAFFHRVERGGSFVPRSEFLGLRGDQEGWGFAETRQAEAIRQEDNGASNE